MTHAAIRFATAVGLSVVIRSGLSAQRGNGAWFGYGLGLSVAHQSRNIPVVNSLTQYTRSSTTNGGIQAYMNLGATPSQFVRVGAASSRVGPVLEFLARAPKRSQASLRRSTTSRSGSGVASS